MSKDAWTPDTRPRNLSVVLGDKLAERAKKSLDDLVEEELKTMILTSGDLKEKTQLLVAAIKFLAVKHRIGPIWGGELDATGSE